MRIANEEYWNEYVESNKDSYGSAVIRYAERWANMMEAEIDKGAKVKDIADKTSNEADTDGITGFMYGWAVKILSDVWAYGEELRKWHNKEYDYEGDGVVNPAILTISAKE